LPSFCAPAARLRLPNLEIGELAACRVLVQPQIEMGRTS